MMCISAGAGFRNGSFFFFFIFLRPPSPNNVVAYKRIKNTQNTVFAHANIFLSVSALLRREPSLRDDTSPRVTRVFFAQTRAYGNHARNIRVSYGLGSDVISRRTRTRSGWARRNPSRPSHRPTRRRKTLVHAVG